MATPTSDKLSFWYASKYLSSDGDTLTQQTADAGGSVTTIVDAALTEADDYWNGAVVYFDKATSTAALQGIFAHVKDFDAATDTITLAQDLPAAPAAGDNYYLILGGNYRGNTEIFGMQADGELPEIDTVQGTNLSTAVTYKYFSALCEEDTLSVFFDDSEDTLQMKMGSEAYGATLDVSGDVSDGVLFGADGEKHIVVDVTAANLPVGDATDTFALTYRTGTFVPDLEAYETGSGSIKTRYRLLAIKNDDGADSMQSLVAYCDKPAGSDTTTTTTATIAAGDVTLTDASDHPTTSYWLYNSTKDDLRFVINRSGNVCTFAAATGGLRGKTAQSWSIGDTVQVFPDFDIGLDAPATNQFENPSAETTAPSGVTFSAPMTAATGLAIGTLAASGIYGIWYRETIIDGARGRNGLIFDTLFQWS